MKFANANKLDRKSGGVAAIILAAGNPRAWGKQSSCSAWVTARCWARPSKTFAALQWMRSFWFSALLRKPSAGSFRSPCSKGSRLWSTRLTSREWRVRCEPGSAALDPQVDAALIVLADQPFVRPETLDQLAEQHRRSKAQIVIPSYKGVRGNPVLLDRSVFAEVMALEGDIGCRAIFSSHTERTVKVEVEDEGILLDIDNQEDYERCEA